MKSKHLKRVPTLTWPALKVPVPGSDVSHYLAVIPAKKLFSACFVSRADEDPQAGFQRTLNANRVKEIAEYLDAGNVIPGSIILSAKQGASLTYSEKDGTIEYRNIPRAFFVIDGQHRLFGADQAKSAIFLSVSILTSLDLEEEARYFNDINGEQRGVPRTLQLEIQKFTEPEDAPEQTRIRIFHALNNRPDSPLVNRLSPTKSVPGKLTHVPFKNAVEPLLDNPLFQAMNEDQKVQLLINFLSAVEDVLRESLGDSRKLSNAAFFQALFFAFPGILQQVSLQHCERRRERRNFVAEKKSTRGRSAADGGVRHRRLG